MVTKYSVWHRNGSGGEWSQWYQDDHGLTKKEAENKEDELIKKSSDGWYSDTSILEDGVNPNA